MTNGAVDVNDLQLQINAKNTLLASITAQMDDLITAGLTPDYDIDGQTVQRIRLYEFLIKAQEREIKSIAELTSLQQRVPGGLSFFLSGSGNCGNTGCGS